MRFEDYTKNQQKAITSKGTNIIVSAGAGSGKTQVLSERVIYFIENENYKLQDFLILTFTNLAAAEMKERIRKSLIERNNLEANNVDVANISTFDSYAYSIVKKYHLRLNLSNKVSIVDSNIIKVRKYTILNEIFENRYLIGDFSFAEMIKKHCFKDDENLKKFILNLYNKAESEIDTHDYLNSFINNYYSSEHINLCFKTLETILIERKNFLLDCIENLTDHQLSKKDTRPFNQVVKEVLIEVINAKNYEELVMSLKNIELPRSPLKLNEDESILIKEFKANFNAFKALINSFPSTREEICNDILDSMPYIKTMIEIIFELDNRIKEYKNRYQSYEFIDIAKMALKLIKDNEDIRESVKNNLKMIMIDEYQDTSILQETFINYISNNNVYMVGDIKQSIYRFRNAKSELFMDKYNKYKSCKGGIAIDLNKNFRSRKEVLDDINYIFKQIMTDKFGGANYKTDHLIEYGNKDYLTSSIENQNNNSDFIYYQKALANKTPEIEASIIAKDIITKINNHYKVMDYVNKKPYLRDCEFSDFCILMDRGSNFDVYSRVFSNYKLPLYVENDEDITNNDIVSVLTSILKLIKAIINNDFTSIDFKVSFFSIARSFLFSYEDEKILNISKNDLFYNDYIVQKVRYIINENNYSTIYELFEQIVFDFDIYQKLILIGNINKNEKYVDYFLDMFKNMSKLDYSIDDFIFYLDNITSSNAKIEISSSSSSLNSIRIMNIHKSKGLEFKIVYYSGLNTKFNRQDLKDNFGISNKYGPILPSNKKEKTNIIKYLNSINEIDEDTSEKIRLFYVALTRAREKMIFLIPCEYVNYFPCDNSKKEKFLYYLDLIKENYNDVETLATFLSFLNIKIDEKYLLNDTLNISSIENLYHQENLNDFEKKEFEDEDSLFNDIVDITDKWLLERFKTAIKTNEYSKERINELLNLFFHSIPFIQELRIFFDIYQKNIVSKNVFKELINKLNIVIDSKFERLLHSINDFKIEEKTEFLNNISLHYFYKEECFDNLKCEKNFEKAFLRKIFELYLDRIISIDTFETIIAFYGYEFSIDFKSSVKNGVQIEKIDSISDVLSQKGILYLTVNQANSMLDFIKFDTIKKYNNFNHKTYSLKRNIELNLKVESSEYEPLEIKEIKLVSSPIEKIKASKELTISSTKSNLNFGTDIHFIMETIDFKNPDYSLLNNRFYEKIIKKFLASDLMKHVVDGEIFKEYVFYDEKLNISGIIDLMVVYKDHIDIIDYKTKNIDNEEYLKQIEVYRQYILSITEKKVFTYLYSLLDGDYIKCN